jgi:DNA-binding HxlR family transcriptional regulator
MRSHDQYCPVAKGAETLGDKWSLLIVRELLHGVTRFNEFERGLPGISRSVLAARLRQLEHSGVIERRVGADGRSTRYRLTPAGRELRAVVDVLGSWAARWIIEDPRPRELDPDLLMLFISRNVRLEALPSHRVVIEFELESARRPHYWLVLLRPAESSLCLRHPGFEPNVVVTADVAALYEVYLGRRQLEDAMRDGLIRLDGPRALVRALPQWFAWSPFAEASRGGLRARALARVATEPA